MGKLTITISALYIYSAYDLNEALILSEVVLTNRNNALGNDQGDFHILSTSWSIVMT
jgi:hypothetical protein